jgi:hypothetical protein
MALVFQYGSNCSIERLNSPDRLNGDAVSLGRADLEGYTLRFDVWSDGNQCAASDIVEEADQIVQGVLYNVPDCLMTRETTPPGRRSFDSIEGPRYERSDVRVRRPDGSTVTAITYTARPDSRRSDILTSVEYVTHIVMGLRDNAADAEYIDTVKFIARQNNPSIQKQIEDL